MLVAWHGDPLGRLTHDGFEWGWKPQKRGGPPLVRETTPGKLPAFIESLLPEGWLAQVLHERDEREALRHGRRYMSNITIVESREELAALPADILATPLAAFIDGGRFTGSYAGPARGEIEETFEQNLARIFAPAETPRLSGVQIKAPMSLAPDGALVLAIDQPFTHILKPAGTAGFETLPVVEWLCLELGRAAGFDVPTTALIEMPDGMSPALLVECFDIRHGPEDQRRLALEDFCSILDLLGGAVDHQVQIINWDSLPFCALICNDNFRLTDLENATWFASLTVNLTISRPPIDPLVRFAQVGESPGRWAGCTLN